jgi:hypothetical protein
MANISGMPIEPQVNDLVLVYRDSGIELYLKVVQRTWWIAYSEQKLICELHLPNHIPDIATLEKFLTS